MYMKLFVIAMALVLSACAPKTITITEKDNPPLQAGELARVTQKVSADNISGVETTTRYSRLRHPRTGEEIAKIDQFETPNTGGEIAKATIPVAVGSLINAAGAIGAAQAKGCSSDNCGTQISVQGGPTVASAGARSDSGANVGVSVPSGGRGCSYC